MAEHPNAMKYRQMMETFNRGEYEDYGAYIADDVEWWEIGRAEPIRGKAALMARSQDLMGKWEIKADLHDVVANNEHLIALLNVEAKRDNRSLAYRTAEIHHIKDGKITHRWAFSDDTGAIIDFFA